MILKIVNWGFPFGYLSYAVPSHEDVLWARVSTWIGPPGVSARATPLIKGDIAAAMINFKIYFPSERPAR